MYTVSPEQDRLLRMQIRSPKTLSEISVPGYERSGMLDDASEQRIAD